MKYKPIYSTQKAQEMNKKDENTTKNREDENEVEYEWGKHPNSLKALKKNQYPKGVSGNIMGRKPQFESLAKQLDELGNEEMGRNSSWCGESIQEPKTKKELVLRRIWNDAIKGDLKKIQLLAWLGCLD